MIARTFSSTFLFLFLCLLFIPVEMVLTRRGALLLNEVVGGEEYHDESFPGVNRLLSREINQFSESFRADSAQGGPTEIPRGAHGGQETSLTVGEASNGGIEERFRRECDLGVQSRVQFGERPRDDPNENVTRNRSNIVGENHGERVSLGTIPSVYRPSISHRVEQERPVFVMPRNDQIRRFSGAGQDISFDDWEMETRIVLDSLGVRTDSRQSVSILLGALVGDARIEVLSTEEDDRKTADDIFNVLSSAFGEIRHPVELQRELFCLSQKTSETVQQFGTRLKALWQKTKVSHRQYGMSFNGGDEMLNGIFVRGLNSQPLRQMAVAFERDHHGISFSNLRREIMIRSTQDVTVRSIEDNGREHSFFHSRSRLREGPRFFPGNRNFSDGAGQFAGRFGHANGFQPPRSHTPLRDGNRPRYQAPEVNNSRLLGHRQQNVMFQHRPRENWQPRNQGNCVRPLFQTRVQGV